MKNDSILSEGLVAHGSCNYNFLTNPKFSNVAGCGCTALGNIKSAINMLEDLASLISFTA